MSDEDEQVGDKLHTALANMLRDHDGSALIKCVAIAEVMDTEGEHGLWLMASPDMKAWETKGFLTEALDTELAQTVRTYDESS